MATLDELVVRIKADASQLERELKRTVGVTQQQSQRMEQGFKGIRSSIKGVADELGIAGNVLGSVIGAVGVRQVITYADTWKQLEGRLRIATKSSEDLLVKQSQLFDIAQNSRAPLEATYQLYTRLSGAIGNNAKAQADLLSVVEAFGKGLAITGESAAAAQGAIVQFSQGIATNFQAGGQELNSLIEQAPRVAQALADGLNELGITSNATRGNLKQLAQDGVITVENAFAALRSQLPKLTEEFERSQVTIAQSFTRLENAFIAFIGQSREVSATSAAFADSIGFVADNMDEFGRIALAVAAILSTRLAIGLAATVAVMSPLSAAITAVVGGLTLLATESSDAQEEQQRHSEAMRQAIQLHGDLESTTGDHTDQIKAQSDALRQNTAEQIRNAEAELLRLRAMQEDWQARTREMLAGTDVPPPPDSFFPFTDQLDAAQQRINNLKSELTALNTGQIPGVGSTGGKPSGNKPPGITGQSEAQKKLNEALSQAGQIYEQTRSPLERYIENVKKAQELRNKDLIDLDTFNRYVKQQSEALDKELAPALERVESQSVQTVKIMKDHFADGLEEIIFDFKNFGNAVSSIMNAIARDIARQQIINPLSSSVSGLLGNAIGGLNFGNIGAYLGIGESYGPVQQFADGGSPPVGRPSIVGERGPEIFVPNSAGTVIPNHALGGTSVTVINNWNISPGIQGTVRAELLNALPAIEARTQASVFRAIERGGTEARIVGKRN